MSRTKSNSKLNALIPILIEGGEVKQITEVILFQPEIELSLTAVQRLAVVCLKQKSTHKLQAVVEKWPEALMPDLLSEIMALAIQETDLSLVSAVVELGQQPSEEQANQLLEAVILKAQSGDVWLIKKLLALGWCREISDVELEDLIVKNLIGGNSHALEVLLPLRPSRLPTSKEIDALIAYARDTGHLGEIEKLARSWPRGTFSASQIDALINLSVRHCSYRVSSFLRLGGSKTGVKKAIRHLVKDGCAELCESVKEFDEEIKEYALRLEIFTKYSLRACRLLDALRQGGKFTSAEATRLFKFALLMNNIHLAAEVAKRTHFGKLSSGQIDAFLARALRKGDILQALKVATYRRSGKLKPKEIDHLARVLLKKQKAKVSKAATAP